MWKWLDLNTWFPMGERERKFLLNHPRLLYKNKKNFYDMVSGSLIFAAFTAFFWLMYQIVDKSLVGGYGTNVITTIGGVIATIFILDKRNENRAEHEFKERLILQMGSLDNGLAREAVRLLELKKWLRDGSLQGINLQDANLQELVLENANLKGAFMLSVNLKGAFMVGANLQYAWMSGANLQGAQLSLANLQGTHLFGANLQEADLMGCLYSQQTILPDNTYWSPNRDMYQFTHPTEWHYEQIAKHAGYPPPKRESPSFFYINPKKIKPRPR